MIFVLMGTNPYPFTRLAKAVDELAGVHQWEVAVQCGSTRYDFKHCAARPYFAHDEVRQHIEACEVLVTQGGAGSISEGLCCHKPVVAVPRYPLLGESQDEQSVLVRRLERLGCILGVYDVADLFSVIHRSTTFVAKSPPPNRIPGLIKNFLESGSHE